MDHFSSSPALEGRLQAANAQRVFAEVLVSGAETDLVQANQKARCSSWAAELAELLEDTEMANFHKGEAAKYRKRADDLLDGLDEKRKSRDRAVSEFNRIAREYLEKKHGN